MPKTLYLSGIVAYEDDQTAIFHIKFAVDLFSGLKMFFLFHLRLKLSWWRQPQ